MYDRTTVRPYKVLLLTCVVNCTAGTPTPRLCSVFQWSVHWAPSRTTRVLVLAGARRCALETCGEKKCEPRFQAWLNLYIRFIQLVGSNYKDSQRGLGARKKTSATHAVSRKSLVTKLKISPPKEVTGSKRMVPERKPQTTSDTTEF